MIDNETISEILFKLTGDISPIQESSYDQEAYFNQEKIMFIVDRCIDELVRNAERTDVYASSVKKISDRAIDYLKELGKYIQDRMNK